MDSNPREHVTEEPAVGNGMAIELDRHVARGVVFSMVEGQGRFVAVASVPSSSNAPIADHNVSLKQVIDALEEQTGMTLSCATDEIGPSQMEVVGVTGQPVSPVRLAIVSTGNSDLVPALSAVARTTTSVIRLPSAEVRTEDGVISGTALDTDLRAFQPDIVVLVAGDKTQSEWPTVVGTIGTLHQIGIVNQIVVLAADELQQHVIQTLGEGANLIGLDPGQYDIEEVAAAVEIELNSVYDARVAENDYTLLPGAPFFTHRSRGADLVTRFLARRRNQTILSVVSSDGTTLNWSSVDSSAMVNRPDVDLFLNAPAVLIANLNRVAAQLPFGVSQDDLRNWVLNRALRPDSVADLQRDEFIEAAFASEIVRMVWNDLGEVANAQIDLIVASPVFAGWSSAIGVMSLLNAIEPKPLNGLVEVILDHEGLLTASGAIGEENPALAADVVEHDLLRPVASVIVVEGDGVEGDLAIRGEIVYEDGETISFAVPSGSIHQLPLAEGEFATLKVVCEPGFSVAGCEPGEEFEVGGGELIRGSELGVLIDARGWSAIASGEQQSDPGRVSNWFLDLGIDLSL